MRIHVLPTLIAAWLALTPSSPAPAYLKLGDIKGESVDADHRDWSNLEAISATITRLSRTNSAGAVTRTAQADVVVTKELDKASPKLVELAATGQMIPMVELHLTRRFGDANPVVYLKYELKNVLVSSYSVGGSANGATVPTDQFSLNFEEIKVTYSQYDSRNGRLIGEVTTTSRFEIEKQ